MKLKSLLSSTFAVTMLAAGVLVASGSPATAAPGAHLGTLLYRGTTTFHAAATGSPGVAQPEFGPGSRLGEGIVNRSLSPRPSTAALKAMNVPRVRGTALVPATTLNLSFQGLDHFDNRFASDGNQFSLEPPDQGLCAGGGFVMETVNDVIRIYDTSGNPLTGAIATNAFYGYPPSIDRTTFTFGPFVFDPSCYYDPEHNRFVHVADDLDVDPTTGAFLGTGHLDIAVSETGDPTGTWKVYTIATQDDGTDGTPNHNCEGGPCFADYPHIGADKNGFYITTNEYAFNANQFITAQIYAISKAQLTSGGLLIPFVHLDNLFSAPGRPGFTMWPAQSPAGSYATSFGGTEFFLSSMAAAESGNVGGGANMISAWALRNTKSLDTTPALVVKVKVLQSEGYSVPPKANQKAGNVPLADCLNINCLKEGKPPSPQVEGVLDSNDTRMQQVSYANGVISGALDTAVTMDLGFSYQAGIAWFVVNPTGTLANQGYLAVSGNHVTYPAIATLADGSGVMAFTLVGNDHYPSAAYAPFSASGPGAVQVAAEGVGPQDGFTEYFIGGGRPRWGDYGAAAIDGSSIWIASEYIGQTCKFPLFMKDFTCGSTRSALANWATRISNVTP